MSEMLKRRIEAFLETVHGMNEMNVVRGIRKVMDGEHTTFTDEVRLSLAKYATPTDEKGASNDHV